MWRCAVRARAAGGRVRPRASPTSPTWPTGDAAGLAPEITPLRAARRRCCRGRRRPRRDPRARRGGARRHAARARARTRPGAGGAGAADEARDPPRPRGPGASDRRARAVTTEDVATFRRCIAVGGVALFPVGHRLRAGHRARVEGGRRAPLRAQGPARRTQPAAVMFFDLELALAALPELGPRTRDARGAAAARARSRCCCRTPPGATRWRAVPSPAASACGCRR